MSSRYVHPVSRNVIARADRKIRLYALWRLRKGPVLIGILTRQKEEMVMVAGEVIQLSRQTEGLL